MWERMGKREIRPTAKKKLETGGGGSSSNKVEVEIDDGVKGKAILK